MRKSSSRLVCASGIVAAVFAVPAAYAAFAGGGIVSTAGAADSDTEASYGNVGFRVSQFVQESDPLVMLDRIDESLSTGSLQPDERFDEEAGFPSDAQEIRASADGSVISCVLETDEEAAFAAVVDSLDAKGWTGVPLQGVDGATFMKASGRLHWMLVTCTQVGEATSVVYRLEIVPD